jgi:hypothetical protein
MGIEVATIEEEAPSVKTAEAEEGVDKAIEAGEVIEALEAIGVEEEVVVEGEAMEGRLAKLCIGEAGLFKNESLHPAPYIFCKTRLLGNAILPCIEKGIVDVKHIPKAISPSASFRSSSSTRVGLCSHEPRVSALIWTYMTRSRDGMVWYKRFQFGPSPSTAIHSQLSPD